ncbi:MAG TPA: glycosyltransferase family 4 protein, partial [Roseiflexaceae bacterium]|nr:glycosyltransferase family 4 protein [Roseiflexaceae bacterium]
EYMARRVRAIVDPARVVVIPNMVDMAAIERTVRTAPNLADLESPFLLYVGKLERNKGAHLLPEIMRELVARSVTGPAELPTLVVAGDGPLRDSIRRDLDALGVRMRFLEWIDHDDVLRLMARCEALVYPSGWGEPLTRVLLEAAACGAVAVAMPTGGTPDIVEHETTGFLEPTPARMAARLHELINQPERKGRMAEAARHYAQKRFSADAVVQRVENLYRQVLG